MQKLFSLLLVMIIASSAFAQKDTIIIHKDQRLDILTAKQAQINKRNSMMTSAGLFRGFRIQLFSSPNRVEANKIKEEFLSRFTDQKAYLTYNSPYFKVRVGNFIKKADAESFRKQLAKYYPSGVYVVEDAVEYTLKDEDDLLNQ